MINFDNSATSFPKPKSVQLAADSVFRRYGGNPGHGGHRLAQETAEKVYEVRELAAEMFAAEPENVIFTANCTLALNMAIKGMMQYGGHMIISDLEHNAVFRPVYALAKTHRVTFSAAHIYDDDEQTLEEIRRLIRSDTRCICCTAASNVTGRIVPFEKIGRLCKSYGICFIADAAQAAGLIDIGLDSGINFLCTSGHKALYGPSGTGMLITDGEYALSTIIEGGTGATSEDPEQTPFYPEKLESGTVNTAGIAGLGAGIKEVKRRTAAGIFKAEKELCRQFSKGLSDIDGVKLYTCKKSVPIVSFNIGEYSSQAVSARLSDKGFALRGGLHCAPLAHRSIGTENQGTVRFSPGIYSTKEQVNALIKAVRDVSHEINSGR